MAEYSRFFDHIDGDRTYNAEEFAEYFRQILTTGVLDSGSNLQVYVNGTDRIARIKPGKAWIEGYFYKLTEELELPLEEAHGTYDRIDRIVLRLNTSTESRNIKAFVKTGELSLTPEPPALIREGNIYEISLAQILILHNTTSIPVENVTDERLDSEVCGLANLALTYEEFALKTDLNMHEGKNVHQQEVHGLKIEEGTFTPEVYLNKGANNHTYSIQKGKYIKINNLVNFTLELAVEEFDLYDDEPPTIYIQGLPFLPSDDVATTITVRQGIVYNDNVSDLMSYLNSDIGRIVIAYCSPKTIGGKGGWVFNLDTRFVILPLKIVLSGTFKI